MNIKMNINTLRQMLIKYLGHEVTKPKDTCKCKCAKKAPKINANQLNLFNHDK